MPNVTPPNKYKLIGKNYTTGDLYAKVTGKAKYAEDYRADGMLFCKLALSPMPHARVRGIDARAALAMPGVKAILTADELPAPANSINDNGTVILANPRGFQALTNEPLYQGQPILAVAAIDELTAAEAIEKIKIDLEPLPFVVDPLVSLRPGGPNARTDGNCLGSRAAPSAEARGKARCDAARTAHRQVDAVKISRRPSKAACRWASRPKNGHVGDVEAGLKNAALVLDETFVTPNTSHQCLETRSTMAYWQNGKVYVHTGTQSTAQTVPAIARWLGIDVSNVVFISEYTGGGFGSKITGDITLVIPALLAKKTGAPVMMRISREEENYIGRGRPSLHGRMKVGFSKEGRITALDMYVICDNGPYDMVGDAFSSGRIVSVSLPAANDALAFGDGPDQHAASQCAEFARGNAGHRDHGTGPRESRAETRRGSGSHPAHELARGESPVRTARGRQAAICHQRIHQGSAGPRLRAVQVE